jgi:hypothetical protein
VLVVVVGVVVVVVVEVWGPMLPAMLCIHVLGMFALSFNIPSRVSLQFIIKMSASEKLE